MLLTGVVGESVRAELLLERHGARMTRAATRESILAPRDEEEAFSSIADEEIVATLP